MKRRVSNNRFSPYYKLSSKKGSLEISIQAIVIVVLAMTLLGLGLTFVKKMFGNIGGISENTFDSIQEQLQRDLSTSDEKLAFSQTKISIERGKDKLLGWGVRNFGSTTLRYYAEFNGIRCPGVSCPDESELNEQWFTFKYNPRGDDTKNLYVVDAASDQFASVNLNIPKSAQPGLYLIDLTVTDNADGSPYASTDIFVTVT